MKRKRYSEEQIIAILKEHEAGASMPHLARRHGVAENTVYRWKSKFGGMELGESKRLRELEQENAKLKPLLAEAELDKAALKELVGGNVCSAPVLQAPDIGCGKASLHKCIRPVDGRSASWP